MKNILYIAATVLLCSSCFHVNTNWTGGSKNAIKGEGPVITKSFDLKDFDRIVINGQADATFTQADTYEVTLRAQENVFDYVDYRVEGTTLILELKDKMNLQTELERLGASSSSVVPELPASSDGADSASVSVIRRETIEALTALGYSGTEAMSAVRSIDIADGMTTEDVLKLALKAL